MVNDLPIQDVVSSSVSDGHCVGLRYCFGGGTVRQTRSVARWSETGGAGGRVWLWVRRVLGVPGMYSRRRKPKERLCGSGYCRGGCAGSRKCCDSNMAGRLGAADGMGSGIHFSSTRITPRVGRCKARRRLNVKCVLRTKRTSRTSDCVGRACRLYG